MFYQSMTSKTLLAKSRALSSGLLTTALLGLSGCSNNPPIQQPFELTPQPPAPVLPAPQAVKLKPVQWTVKVIDGVPYFALDSAGYENLSVNMGELLRWTGEANWQLDFYRRTRVPAKLAETPQ